MAKRFTDTELWQKEWFLRLPDLHRQLFLYIKDNCDCAGVYEANYMLLSFIFRKEITADDILAINQYKNQIEKISDYKFFITDFCKFQYGELKETCKPHLKVIETLKKHQLFERVSKGYPKGIHTLEEKEKEEDKEELEEEKKDISCNLDFEKCFEIYKENCKNLLPLCFERRSKAVLDELNQFLIEINYDFEYFLNLCKKADILKKIVDNKIDFRSMIKCHIGITNGKYNPKKEDKPPQTVITMNYPTAEETRKRMESYKIKENEEENRKAFEAFKANVRLIK